MRCLARSAVSARVVYSSASCFARTSGDKSGCAVMASPGLLVLLFGLGQLRWPGGRAGRPLLLGGAAPRRRGGGDPGDFAPVGADVLAAQLFAVPLPVHPGGLLLAAEHCDERRARAVVGELAEGVEVELDRQPRPDHDATPCSSPSRGSARRASHRATVDVSAVTHSGVSYRTPTSHTAAAVAP